MAGDNRAQREYEKLYQEYLRNKNVEEGQRAGRNVARKRDKFNNDFIVPAAKAASSFTPVGPVVGAMDAIDSYKKGDRGAALVGAAAEVIPAYAKGMYKLGMKFAEDMPSIAANSVKNFDYYNSKPINPRGKFAVKKRF